jgi:hypothetical protein
MINPQGIISLIPKASIWIEEQEEIILSNGIPLTEKQISNASKIGIKNTGKIRLLQVELIQEPEDSILNEAS